MLCCTKQIFEYHTTRHKKIRSKENAAQQETRVQQSAPPKINFVFLFLGKFLFNKTKTKFLAKSLLI